MNNKTFSNMCEALLAAEKELAALKTYWGNLPVDKEYDLGFRIDLSWGSSCTGYQEMRTALHSKLRGQVRLAMAHAVQEAEEAVVLARNEVVLYAKGFEDA